MKKITQKKNQKKTIKGVPTVKTEMTGKNLTTYAGLLPILNFMKRLKFNCFFNETVRVERSPNAVYQFIEAVQMVILGLMTGATSMSQIATVCKDDVLVRIAGWGNSPVSTTLTRIMKLVNLQTVIELGSLNHRLRGRVWKKLVRSGNKVVGGLVMWLDVDSTVDGVCGNQEGAEKGYNPKKKGQKSYHPIIAFVSSTKEILHSWFRCGSAYTSNGVIEFMKECMAHIKKGTKVIFRGDSGFFSGDLLNYLEGIGGGYLIKVKLKNLTGLLSKQEWTEVLKHSEWEQAIFNYQCSGWTHARKFVAVRRLIRIEKGLIDMPVYEYFCYVTTESLSPMEAHKKYGERATCETWIEECKSQIGAGSIRTSDFLTNSALFQCAVLAYNLIKWMGLLTGGTIAKWEIKTIRFNFIRLAGKLVETSRYLIIKLPERFLYQDKWRDWEEMSLGSSLA